MTSLADPLAQAARHVDGRVWPIGSHVLVCRHAVSTSLPIPLSVRFPVGIDLVAWAFAGFGDAVVTGRTLKPVALLVLGLRDAEAAAALREAGGITLETHFHDIGVIFTGASEEESLTSPEREALCAAVLAAVTPETFPVLSALFPFLRPVIDALPVSPSAPALTVGDGAEGASFTLAGFEVPNYLLIRAGDAMSCARVVSARVRPSPQARADLVVETVWGRPSCPPERVVMLLNGRFALARLAAAEAAR